MHREQLKCRLRHPPLCSNINDPSQPDFSTCSANLRAPRLNLFIHMIGTALADAWRGRMNRTNGIEHKPDTQKECAT